MLSPLSFDDVATLTPSRLGTFDLPCPLCGSNCRSPANRKRKVMRIWRDEPGFIRYHCARCNVSGYVRSDGAHETDARKLAQFRARAAEERRREEARKGADTRKSLKLWNKAHPGQGSIIESYLTSRALDPAFASLFRFHPHCPHPNRVRLPAMLALVEHTERGATATHRTFLHADGAGKARIDPDRASLGAIGGAAVRLTPILPDEWLVVGEGIETTLSVMQASGLPGWAALSAGGIEKLVLPRAATKVIIAVDNDKSGRGQQAAQVAAQRWLAEGRRVRAAIPPGAGDFNDVLTEKLKVHE